MEQLIGVDSIYWLACYSFLQWKCLGKWRVCQSSPLNKKELGMYCLILVSRLPIIFLWPCTENKIWTNVFLMVKIFTLRYAAIVLTVTFLCSKIQIHNSLVPRCSYYPPFFEYILVEPVFLFNGIFYIQSGPAKVSYLTPLASLTARTARADRQNTYINLH